MLEDVANRRAVLFQQVTDWRDYQVLVAAADCRLLGRSGWFVGSEIKSALVVDCAQAEHRADMVGWVDANVGERKRGWLVLR